MEQRNGHHPGEKMVDLGGGKNVMVKVLKGSDGIEKGEYVDPNTGMKFTVSAWSSGSLPLSFRSNSTEILM